MAIRRKLRRGFKSEANNWSREFRVEMGLPLTAPICPWNLAAHLDVPIYKVSELATAPPSIYLTTASGKDEFSATVCFDGIKAFVVSNDMHTYKRQASNIAHELAHIILRHPPDELFDDDGSRKINKTLEDEAEWLGPALLISEEAALHAYGLIQVQGLSLQAISDQYQVTEEVIQMRMNVIGAKQRYRFAAE